MFLDILKTIDDIKIKAGAQNKTPAFLLLYFAGSSVPSTTLKTGPNGLSGVSSMTS